MIYDKNVSAYIYICGIVDGDIIWYSVAVH